MWKGGYVRLHRTTFDYPKIDYETFSGVVLSRQILFARNWARRRRPSDIRGCSRTVLNRFSNQLASILDLRDSLCSRADERPQPLENNSAVLSITVAQPCSAEWTIPRSKRQSHYLHKSLVPPAWKDAQLLLGTTNRMRRGSGNRCGYFSGCLISGSAWMHPIPLSNSLPVRLPYGRRLTADGIERGKLHVIQPRSGMDQFGCLPLYFHHRTYADILTRLPAVMNILAEGPLRDHMDSACILSPSGGRFRSR
jgi:hypothetical protein